MRHALRPQNRVSRFGFDYGLVCALLDRWRPETHTFHFPWGEMTLTLEDVTLLLGLPCAGRAMGAADIPQTWRQNILQRFAPVVRNGHAPAPAQDFISVH